MRTSRYPLSLLLLAATVAACGSDSPTNGGGQQFGTVRGSVLAEGAGVAAATLQLARTGASTRSATTNSSGEYEFTQVAVGSYSLTLTLPTGFQAVGSGEAAVTVAANQTATVNFQAAAASGPAPEVTLISITDTGFDPNDVTVPVGRVVRWRNDGTLEHNSTGTGGTWTGPNIGPTQTYERVFNEAGVFPYVCTLHANMNGTIRVE